MTSELSADERELLIRSVRRLLEDRWPVERAVELANDVQALRQLSGELRDLGLAELGAGDAPALREMLLIFEELGRASCPAPLIGTYLANRLFVADHPDAQAFYQMVRAGQAVPAIALANFDGDRAAGSVLFDDGKLSGRTAFVESLGAATHLIVLVTRPLGAAVVRLNESGVRTMPTPGLAVPPLSEVELDCPAIVWQQTDADRLTDAARVARLCSTARALGAAQRAFDLALAHAQVRRQFGHLIGEFQAIQHKLADCLTRLEGTRLALAGGADACDRADAAWRVFADAAIAFAGPALRQVLLDAHHTLGAIGYAEEHEAPRHFRSVHSDLVRFGGTARARAALADHLLAASCAQER